MGEPIRTFREAGTGGDRCAATSRCARIVRFRDLHVTAIFYLYTEAKLRSKPDIRATRASFPERRSLQGIGTPIDPQRRPKPPLYRASENHYGPSEGDGDCESGSGKDREVHGISVMSTQNPRAETPTAGRRSIGLTQATFGRSALYLKRMIRITGPYREFGGRTEAFELEKTYL